MKLADILKSDANALKLFTHQQISTLEASLIADDKGEKLHLNCLRRKKIQSLKIYPSNFTVYPSE